MGYDHTGENGAGAVLAAKKVPRILIVDDDEASRTYYGSYLRFTYGWEVVEAGNGADALSCLDASISAVLLDEMMPGLRGMEVLEKIRERVDLKGLCVIMLTATMDPVIIADTSKYKPDAYFLKQYATPEAVYTALASNIRQTGLVRAVNAFLCHSSIDKDDVRELQIKLKKSFVDAWFDEKSLIGGQKWKPAIRKALQKAEMVIVCLSPKSVATRGYMHNEIGYALEVAESQPEGSIYIVPLKLKPCEVPDRLSDWHWIDYTCADGWNQLMLSIRKRAEQLQL